MLIRRIAPACARLICYTLLLTAATSPAWSWNPVGHRIVAKIAEKRLHPQAHKRFQLLAGRSSELASLATWADDIREDRPETAPWHYINIPEHADALHLKIDCPGGDCVTMKAREFLGVVRLGLRDREYRLEGLRFLVHLMGDLHQPLHAGLETDRGGNDTQIEFHGKKSNLHQFWDSDLLDANVSDEEAFVEQLASEISLQDENKWSRGHLTDWTWESRQLALKDVYGPLPRGKHKTIDDAYSQKAWEITKEQLKKAGVRLAVVMNEMWGY